MGVILRTAGAARSKIEIKRDFEYLLRMWETVRDLTLKSTAPKLVYEEGSLVKRSLRDLYSKDIDEVTVAGADAYHEAKEFMRMLMPSHAKNVKLYTDTQPLLSRYGVENQLDAMFSPVVQLRSGGYIVLNQAEALVAIDVNSGRATREHHIEDTAFKTNLEAADEIARQLRLRDLAGLIVIDFIDMDEKRNNRTVERRLKECLKHDRARIQVGRISHFGLLEMSRQRIRTSVLESSTEKCPYCGGSGHVRSVSSLALQVLRALEEHLIKGATHNLIARTRPDVALYVLNQKRRRLSSSTAASWSTRSKPPRPLPRERKRWLRRLRKRTISRISPRRRMTKPRQMRRSMPPRNRLKAARGAGAGGAVAVAAMAITSTANRSTSSILRSPKRPPISMRKINPGRRTKALADLPRSPATKRETSRLANLRRNRSAKPRTISLIRSAPSRTRSGATTGAAGAAAAVAGATGSATAITAT
jgi:hypothetical protein